MPAVLSCCHNTLRRYVGQCTFVVLILVRDCTNDYTDATRVVDRDSLFYRRVIKRGDTFQRKHIRHIVVPYDVGSKLLPYCAQHELGTIG